MPKTKTPKVPKTDKATKAPRVRSGALKNLLNSFALRQKAQEFIKSAGLNLAANVTEEEVHGVADQLLVWADKTVEPKNPFLELLTDLAFEMLHELAVACIWSELTAMQTEGAATPTEGA